MNGVIKKKYVRLLGLLTALLIATSPLAAHVEPIGVGAALDAVATSGTPIEIRTPRDMADFLQGRGANYGTFVVMNDIDMTGVLPINPGRPGTFTGTLRGHVDENGNRPVVSGIQLTHQGGPEVPRGEISRRLHTGIIQEAGSRAVVEDIVFDGVTLTEVAGVLTYPVGIASLIGHVRAGGNVDVNNVNVVNVNLSIGHTLPRPNHANTRLGGMVGMVSEGGALTIRDINVEGNLTTVYGPLARLNIAGGVVGENRGHLIIGTREGTEERNEIGVNIRRTGNVAVFSHAGGVIGRVFATLETPTGSISTLIEDTVVTATDVIGGNRVGGFIGETGTMGMVTIRDSAVIPAINPPVIPVGTISSTLRESDVGGFIGRTMTMTGSPTGTHIIIERVENHANVIGAPNPNIGATNTRQGMREVGGIVGRNMAPTVITEATNYGEIRHGVMRRQANAAGRTGGIVGRSSASLHIHDSANHGNMTRAAVRQWDGSPTAGHASGGIVAWVEHSGTNVANQVLRMNNVTNYGDILGTTRGAGGIVGRVTHGVNAASVTHITTATNRGLVRGQIEVGGIIGGIRSASDVRIDGGTMNYGHIWSTANAHVGGIVGFANGPRLQIHQAGNAGRISVVAGTGSAIRGVGGILGESRPPRREGFVLREVFNEGTVTGINNRRTGGIVGWQGARGTLFIEDFFSVGVVRTQNTSTTALRSSAAGVVGSRTSGDMSIRRGYVYTRANGHLVAQDARRTAGRPIRRATFSQVYIVNTIGIPSTDMRPGQGSANPEVPISIRNRLHILQPGINVIGGDLLATGLIPGVNHTLTGPWRVGIYDHAGSQATLPYFAWQTRHTDSGLQERFFFDKGDYRHHLYGIAPTSGHQNFEYSGLTFGSPEDLNYPIVRHFDPRGWGWEARTVTNAMGEEGNRPVITEASGYVRAYNKPTGRITSGLISPNHVIAFGEAADTDLFIIQAIDMDCPFQTPIGHANLSAGEGVDVILNVPGFMITRREMITLPWWVSAEALGYELVMPPSVEPGRFYLTQEDIDNGFVNIPMRRVPIDREIYVFVRDGDHDVGDDRLQPNLWVASGNHHGFSHSQALANATVFHHTERARNAENGWDDVRERVVRLQGELVIAPAVHVHPVGSGQGHIDDPRPVVGIRGPLPRNTVTVGDPMRAGSAGYDWFEQEFAISMIDDLNATGPLTVTIELDDITIPNNTPVRLVEIIEDEEGEEVEVLIPRTYNPDISVRRGEGVNPPLTPLGRTGNNPFALNGATLLDEILATADGFIPVGWDLLEEHFTPFQPAEEGEPAIPAHITIVMERGDLVEFDVRVVEEASGGSRLIPNSSLTVRGETLTSPTGVFEGVSAAVGDELVAAANRFNSSTHMVTDEDDGVVIYIYLTREDLEPGTIAGFVWNADESDTPIPGATVNLFDDSGLVLELIGTTTADEDGFFEFTGLDSGTYRVDAFADDFSREWSVVDPIILGAEEGVWADVYLYPHEGPGPPDHYRLVIDVVNPAGARIEAATVTFSGTNVPRDETWDVRLSAPRGGQITAAADNFRLGAASVAAGDFEDNFHAVTITLHPITLEPGRGGIHGFVTSYETGLGIEDALILVENAAGEVVATRRTDEFGRYEVLNLLPGEFNVMVIASGYETASADAVVVADAMTRVDFVLGDDDTFTGDYTLLANVTGQAATTVVVRGTPEIALRLVEGRTDRWVTLSDAPLTGRTVEATAADLSDTEIVGTYTDRVATVNLHLEEDDVTGAGIRGVVNEIVDGALVPVPNASIAITDGTGAVVGRAITDAQGRYQVDELAVGPHTVHVSHLAFYSQYRNVTTLNEEWVTANFTLIRRADGPVNYLLEAFVLGGVAAEVYVEGGLALANTGGNRWELGFDTSLTGETVIARAANHRPGSAVVGAHDATTGVASVTVLIEPIPPTSQGIYGTVRGPEGSVAGARVFINNESGVVREVTTNALGHYEALDLPVGQYTVTVVAGGFITQSRDATVTTNNMTRVDFTLVAGGAAYRVIAIVAGAPADDITVTINRAGVTFTRVAGTNIWEAGSDTPLTGAVVTASAPLHTDGTATVGAHDANGVAVVSINLVPDSPDPGFGGIRGTVTSLGDPVANATIIITNVASGDVYETTTDSSGNYVARRLPAGLYTVTVIAAGFNSQSTPATVVVGEWTIVNFNLTTRVSTHVVIATVTGANPSAVTVEITGAGVAERIGTTNIWEIHGTAPFTGEEVSARALNYRTAYATVGAHDAHGIARVSLELVRFPLPPGQGGIFGRVTDTDRAPIANATILVTFTETGAVTQTSTNAAGMYEVLPLASGAYTVTVVRAGFYTQYRATTVVADEMTEENFVLLPEAVPTTHRLLVTVTGANPADVTVTINRDVTLERIGTTNTWQASTIVALTGAIVEAVAEGFYPATATVGAHDANGVARVTLNLVPRVTPITQPLTVSNLPVAVETPSIPTGQSPESNENQVVGSVLAWYAGTPAPAANGGTWYFLGWADSREGLVVGQPVPPTILVDPADLPTAMPNAPVDKYVLWGDASGRFGQPEPPQPPPPPPTRELIINNSPIVVEPVNQSPVTDLAVEVGTPLTWCQGTDPLPADCGGTWHFIKWATTTDGLEAGMEPPAGIAKILANYAYKPDADTVAYVLWGDAYGRYGQPQPPAKDGIVIDVDEDGNVDINLPDDEYDLDWDDDGNITIVIPDREPGEVEVNVPGDDWDYDITVDEDGNVVVVITPPNRVLTVSNFPTWVVVTGQGPTTGPRPVGSVLDWDEGTPPEGLFFRGWSDTVANLTVGSLVPDEILMDPPKRMPGVNTTVFAIWVDEEGRIPPKPVDPDDIIIDVDEDGNVEINLDEDEYDLYWDDNGNITIVIPDRDPDEVVVNLPGDDWDYDITVDEDGNVIVEIIPPNRMLTVANFPSWVVTAGQTPVTGLRPVGSVLPWSPGTPVAISLQAGPPAPIADLEFAGWVGSTENLAVGYPVPAEELVTPPGRMPGVNSGFYAVWVDEYGNIPPSPCCDNPNPCPGVDCDVCFNCDDVDPCDDCGYCPDCCDCPAPPPPPPPPCCDNPDICPGDDCDVCFNCGDEVPCDDCGKCPDCCDCIDTCCDDPNLCPGCNECMTCGDLTECDECGYCNECCKCEDTCCDDPNLCPGCNECMTCGDLTECDECGYCDKCCKCDDRCCPDPRPCPDCGECMGCGPYGKCTGCGRCTDCCRCTAPPPPPQPPRPPTRDPERRPVPKTGDDANMTLWLTLFGFGLFGLAATSTTLVKAKKKEEIPTFVITGDDGKEHQIKL